MNLGIFKKSSNIKFPYELWFYQDQAIYFNFHLCCLKQVLPVWVSEWVCLLCFRWVLTATNMGWLKWGFFLQIVQIYLSLSEFLQCHFWQCHSVKKLVKATCCYCLTSICNWWYQGELGFCCKEAELCITVYGHVCVYILLDSTDTSQTNWYPQTLTSTQSQTQFYLPYCKTYSLEKQYKTC